MNRKLLHLFFGLALLLSSCAKEFTELNLPKIVTVSTSPASSITLTTATIGGNVSSAEQHPITSRGIVYGRTQNPTLADSTALSGSGSGVFSTTLSGLAPSTRYYARAFATVDLGTAYGNEVSFTTSAPPAATVTTTSATGITSTGATTGGNVTADGGAAVTARGVAYGMSQNPTTANSTTSDGTGIGAFTSTLTGLTASTLYYVRAYATNSVGTGYGSQVSFTTLSAGPAFTCGTSTVSDVDNNTYATVQIGTQCWTQSNLKVSKYRNGNNISNIIDNSAWDQTSTGAWCNYSNNAANGTLYGKLYNWYAVNDSRGLCPTGWHVPSDAEWTTLTTILGGESSAGGKMKSTATQPTPGGWNSPNTSATNLSGFTGLPGGHRVSGGGFYNLGIGGLWWSSSDAGSGSAWYRGLGYNDASAGRHNDGLHRSGLSVRCARD
jgi:uncharacterized protein (TIGR02145 family)